MQKRVAVAPVAGGKRGKGGASRLGGEEEDFLDEEAKVGFFFCSLR